ncbi:MAG: hypothetical protein M1457_00050, partial [bacterium]|nr:hypothetical protein [bacterium]
MIVLEVCANGEFTYTIRGHYARVSVAWNFEAPPGGGDTHYSIMRGAKANLIIRQGKEQSFKPTLYVENRSGASDAAFGQTLAAGLAVIGRSYPGVAVRKGQGNWEIVIPEAYKVGHEAHFAQVTAKFLQYLAANDNPPAGGAAGDGMPSWEVPGMITKYYTIMQACRLSRQSPPLPSQAGRADQTR